MSTIRQVAVALLAALAVGTSAAAETRDADGFKARLTAAQAQLGLDVVQRLSASSHRPITATSPASIAGAAVAINLGASREMRDALHSVLGFETTAASTDDLALLRDSVAHIAAGQAQESPLRMAHSIAFDRALKLHPGITPAMRKAGIGQEVVDFATPTAVATINRHIREQTGGKIVEIVDQLASGTSLVTLDALYFKDRWKIPFDRANTRAELFKRVKAAPITTSTMHLPQGHYLFRQDAHFVAIELPFANERFRMVIVTTRGEDAAPVATFLQTAEWLGGKGFMSAPGELALPHFDVSSHDDVTPVLDARGLRAARSAPNALEGFTSDPIRIARVVQCLELRLTEEGAEVAAATAAIAERGLEGGYVHMVVDKPFMFALRDTGSGLVLATGYVGEPAGLASASRP